MNFPNQTKAHWQEILALRVAGALLLVCALVSGFVTCLNLRDLDATYQTASPELQLFMLYGPLTPMIVNVRERTEVKSSILLLTDADPALIAYGLYPRQVSQPTVDAALEPMFAPRKTSTYPQRLPKSFAVDWILRLTPENIVHGGDLQRMRSE